MKIRSKKIIIIITVLLVISFLSIGFSAFQKQLLIDDSIFNVRLQVDTRVSGNTVQKVSGNAVSNSEDYNVKKIYGSVTFPTTSSYVLYKVDLTNYGNVKTGLLDITSNSTGINYQVCDSNGSNCTSDPKTSVCNGSNCTLGSTKTIYVKVTSTSTGTKNVDLDLEFAPIHTVTYENFRESTSSFKADIMEGETYEVTLTSSPEEVSGTNATANYNSSNNKLTIAGVTNDATITAKYLATDIAQTSYTGTNPSNYVRFNNTLYRIITKETINDGYGNEELRAKIISYNSIGNNTFDASSNDFGVSSLAETLNTTYYNGLNETSQGLIDTALWTEDYANYVGLIKSSDFTSNSSWLTNTQYTLTPGTGSNITAIISGSLTNSAVTVSRATYPAIYLSKDVLIVGGSGTSTNPYILDIKSDYTPPNPALIKGRNLTVTGSAQPLVTVENQIGTPRYSLTTPLNSSNYTSGSTTIPTRSATGTYTIYYYIPAVDGFKPKQGSVRTTINGITYTISYTKGDNISEIGKTSDTCTTSGTSLTCNVTLPSITPASGWENGKWNYNSNTYNPNSSFTLNSSNTGLTMTSSVTGKTYTATIYYYNGSAATSTTRTCTVSTGNSCTFTLTTTVTNSRGVYNSAYKGLASATNSMTSAALSMTQDTTFYAIYSGSVSNRYRGTTSYTTRTLYRNEFFKSNSELDVKLALSNDSATNYTPESGIGGSTWLGLSTANDTTAEYNSVETAAASASTSLYTIYQFSITYAKGANVSAIGSTGGTCKVTSATSCNVTLPTITPNTGYTSVGWSATNGATTGVTGTYTISTSGQTLYANATGSIYTATFYYYDGSNINTTTSSCTVSNVEGNCTVSIPAAVQASSGPYGSPYKGVSATTSTMEAGSLTISTNGTKFYANYSSGDATNTKVTRYYYSSGYKSGTIYRNEYFISDSSISTVLTTADNGTTNYTSSRGPGSSNWLGLSTAQDTTPEYNTVQAAANSTNRTFYTVYQFVINYQKGANVSAIGSDSATCNVTTSDTSCSVILPTITPNTGYTSVGWSTENGATSGQAALTTYILTANNRVLYANAVLANYINTTTNESYSTLYDAFNAVANNQTIKVLQNTTETYLVTLASGKTGVKLDLNGKTITSSNSLVLLNDGTLDIYNTSSTTGTISSDFAISNNGTLTLNGTSTANKIIIESTDADEGNRAIHNESEKNLTINNNVEVRSINGSNNAIDNMGIIVITGGTVSGTNYGINNSSSGQLNISGSSTQIIGTSSFGIYNSGTTTINNGTVTGSTRGINNVGILTINGGAITGTYGLYNTNSGTATINGGSITGSTYGIYNISTATATILGGTITSPNRGIYLYAGTLTLGTKDSTVSTSSPEINTTGTSGKYGVYIRSGSTFNFYDGIVKSSSGTGYSLYGTAADTPTGYSVYKETTGGVESAYLVGSYLNTSTGVSYPTLNEAFSSVSNNQTIKVIVNITETNGATLASGKTGIKLDLNGKTITMNNKYIQNNGALDIYNTSSTIGTINGGSSYVLNNNGTLTLNGTSSTNKIVIDKTANNNYIGAINNFSNSLTINNNVEIKVSEGTSSGIYNQGTLTITGGTITGSNYGINNQPAGQLNISGSSTQITGTSDDGIHNYGVATISGGTITGASYGISNSGTATITGGTITGSSYGIYNNYNSQLEISGSSTQIIGNGASSIGVHNSGTTTISGGTITGSATGLYNAYSYTSETTYYGTTTITGGTIQSSGSRGIYVGSGTTVTLGTKDSSVSTSSPLVQTTGTSNNYGVAVSSGGIFNFYDGIVKSSSGTGNSIYGTVSDIPTGYAVYKETVSGVESAYLVQANYTNTTTGKGYLTLMEAFSAVANNQTIKVMQNTTETTNAILANTKTGVKLDLNGKTITTSAANGIYNQGGLDIYNTSSTAGIISGSGTYTIYNTGTLTTNNTSSTNSITIRNTSSASSARAIYILSSTSATLNTNTNVTFTTGTTGNRNLIQDNGSLTIDGATLTNNVSATANYDRAVGMQNANSTFTMQSGSISANGPAVFNQTSTSANAVTINGGTISSTDSYAITNYVAGTVSISNGTLNGTYGVYNNSTGTVIVTGGTITGTVKGIYSVTGGTVTLGTKDSNTSSSSPIVQSTYASSSYGVHVVSGATFNFYDGIVKSSSGTGKSINGTVTDTPTGYTVYKETVSGVESAYLVGSYLNTSTGSSYTTLSAAFGAVANNQTIKVMQNTTETTNAILASTKTGVKLDLNGKTIIINSSSISNNGTLDIYNTSSTAGTINGGVASLISNSGTLTLNGTSSSNNIVIEKTSSGYGTLGTILNSNSKSLTVNNNVTINASTDGAAGIYNVGSLTVNGGSINSSSSTAIQNDSSGTITVKGGSITSISSVGINNSGIVAIENGTITGNSTGLTIASTGTATITGGTISGASHGIYLNGGTLTLGTKDSSVSTSSPLIQTTGSSNSYGVNIISVGTFNFYDGIIKSSSGTGYAINGTVTDTPTGYTVYKETVSGVESAYLTNGSSTNNYKNLSTNATYGTLNAAFSAVGNNQTIQVLNDVTETTTATLASTKEGIILDLNGYTVTNTTGNVISNSGTLNIISSRAPGTIRGSVYNNGFLYANDPNFNYYYNVNIIGTTTASQGKVIENASSSVIVLGNKVHLSFNSGSSSERTLLYNSGYANISGEFVTASVNDRAFYNDSSLYLTNTTISGVGIGIYNSAEAHLHDSTVTSTGNHGVYNTSSGYFYVGDANEYVSTSLPLIETTSTTSYGIYNVSGGTVHINDGIVKASGGSGKSIYGIVNVQSGYVLTKDIVSGVERAYLTDGTSNILMQGTNGGANTNFLRTSIKKQDIESITFSNSKSGHIANGTNCWDVSSSNNGSVLAWVTDSDSDGLYEMTIGANGIIRMSSGSYLFSNLTNLAYLTYSSNIKYLSTFDVTDMSYMFDGCSSLLGVLLDYFDTSSVTNMAGMFRNCSSIDVLDFPKNFDTSKVTNMNSMFYGCSSLTTIYATTSFVTTSVIDSAQMFLYCNSLEGGAGTTYSARDVDETYAHIDEGYDNPGYFTEKNVSGINSINPGSGTLVNMSTNVLKGSKSIKDFIDSLNKE